MQFRNSWIWTRNSYIWTYKLQLVTSNSSLLGGLSYQAQSSQMKY